MRSDPEIPATPLPHRPLRVLPWVLLLTVLPLRGMAQPTPAPKLDKAATVQLLRTIDERTRSPGDFKLLFYVEQKKKGERDSIREGIVYRRDADRKMMIVLTKPKSEQGKGYLRLERNLWMYDATVGRWERKTDRERIAGTDSHRADFDESRLAEEYEPTFEGQEKLGAFDVYKVSLTVKPGMDVAYPRALLWVDVASGNTLKRQDFALSGRLMRTEYYPKWNRLASSSQGKDIWFPHEVRIYDEVEKTNSTRVVFQSVDPRPLPQNLFTKAWLESQSR
jgi:hypothetical protein